MAFLDLGEKISSGFRILFLAAALTGLSILLYLNRSETHTLTLWGTILFTAMYFYLGFIFLRTLFHLLLSFAQIFFREIPQRLKSFPLVSIIVPCYNEELVLEKAIASILQLTYPNFEVIIVDDGSKDRTLEVAASLKRQRKTRVISQLNAGKAEALNRGIRESFGEYFLCMDADSNLAPDTLEKGMAYFVDRPGLASVAGAVEIGNVTNLLTAFQKLEYISGLNLFKVAQSYLSMVTVIPGPIGLFHKEKVLAVGGYSANTYAEDCELTLRLLMAGYQTEYTGEMVAYTEAPEDLASLISQRYRWSRGVVQAIRQNSHWLLRPSQDSRNFMVMFYMSIESIFIPTCNFFFAFLSIQYALTHTYEYMFGQFFLQLTLLDMILVLYCIITEQRSLFLVAVASVNRLTYGLSLETLRFFAVVDEFLGLPMTWSKLARKGLR